MIAVPRNISDRVERRRELEATVGRLDRFAGVVSRDPQNPLAIAEGRATLARDTGDPEHFDVIEAAAN